MLYYSNPILAAIPSAIQFFGFMFMPESPRWLVSKGKIEEAKKVLFKIRAQDEYPEQELREIQIAVDEEKVSVLKYINLYTKTPQESSFCLIVILRLSKYKLR